MSLHTVNQENMDGPADGLWAVKGGQRTVNITLCQAKIKLPHLYKEAQSRATVGQ